MRVKPLTLLLSHKGRGNLIYREGGSTLNASPFLILKPIIIDYLFLEAICQVWLSSARMPPTAQTLISSPL
jgi:hypothetical protein